MLFCKNITKSFGTQTLFAGADFQLNRGERIGIVGRNGAGKSTLFRLITRQDSPEDGEISYPEKYEIGSLDQHLQFTAKNIREEVILGLPADQTHDAWRAEKLLSGLGFSEADFEKAPDQFSGGFQIRVKLAQLLLSQPDCLLLDEPTNYLDIVTIRWLERFLKSWPGEIICISHDQAFLERITTHTLVIHRQQFKKIKGPPAKAYAQIAKEETIQERTRVTEAKKTAKQEKFIREFRAGARSAGLVQSRIKMLAKKEKVQALPPIPPIRFQFTEATFNGAKLLDAHNLRFGYTDNTDLLRKVSLEVCPGDKIGVIGANGKGKSTLLKVLNQELEIQGGTLKKHVNTHVGYIGQSNVDRLEPEKTILQELQTVPEVSEQMARNIAGNLLFSGGLALKPIKVLSGGEKSRVNLGKVLLTPVNCLLLDEPTNHLDYESIEAFIKAVKDFEGAVLCVSHNEAFLTAVADKLIVFDDDTVYFYTNDYQTFLREKGFVSEQDDKPTPQEITEKRKNSPVHRSAQKELQRVLRPLKRQLGNIEKEILKLETSQAENVENFKKAERQGNRLKMETLGIEYSDLQKELEAQWDQWNNIAAQITDIGSDE